MEVIFLIPFVILFWIIEKLTFMRLNDFFFGDEDKERRMILLNNKEVMQRVDKELERYRRGEIDRVVVDISDIEL